MFTYHSQETIHSQVTFRETPVTLVELVRKCIQSTLAVDSKVGASTFMVRLGAGSWKTWKAMEFYNFIFQPWTVLKFRCG